MPVFESTEKMYDVLGTLFKVLADDPVVGPKYRQSVITIKFTITDPDGFIWITKDGQVSSTPTPGVRDNISQGRGCRRVHHSHYR